MKKSRKKKNNQTANKPKKQKFKKGPPPKIKNSPTLKKNPAVFQRLSHKIKRVSLYLWNRIKQSWLVKTLSFILVAIPVVYLIYDRYFKSPYEKFLEKNIQQGTVEFPPIKDSDSSNRVETNVITNASFYIDSATYHYPLIKGILVKNLEKKSEDETIYFNMGTNVIGVTKRQLYLGVNLFTFLYSNLSSTEPLILVAKGNRIYVSAKFVDLRTENEIGEMEFNHWKIYNSEFLDYHAGDDKFEVIDKQGNIVFSIANIGTSSILRIAISGYFNIANEVVILNTQSNKETQLDEKSDINMIISKTKKDWLKQAMIEVAKIKSVFPQKR